MKTFYIYDVEAEGIIRVQGVDARDALFKYLKKFTPDLDTENMGIAEADFNGYVIESFIDLEDLDI